MEYQVPQFIEVEDKIFGPLTLKQFIFLAGGTGLVVVLLMFLPLFLGLLLAIPVGGFALMLAFFKMNGRTFIELLEYGFMFYLGKRLYLWKKEKEPVRPEAITQAAELPPLPPKEALSKKKLEELAWTLDVHTGKNQTIT